VSGLESLVAAAARSLEPLAEALDDASALEQLLADLGWELTVEPDDLDTVRTLLPVLEALGDLPGLLDDLGGSPAERAAALVELTELTSEVSEAVAALATLTQADVAGLPRYLSASETWSDLAAALPDHLLATELDRTAPAVFGVLRLLGLLGTQHTGRSERYRFRWDQLGAVLADPAGVIRDGAQWGDGFRSWPLQQELGRGLARLGAPVRIRPLQPDVAEAIAGGPVESPAGFESEVALFHGVTPGGAASHLGFLFACSDDGGGTIYVGNLASGERAEPLPLNGTWTLTTTGALNGCATLGVRIQPSGVSLVGGDAALGAAVALAATPDEPWLLFGSADGTRVELDGMRVELGVGGATDDAEAYLLAGIDEGAFRFVLDLGVADAFLRGVIGAPPAITAGGELRWGTSSGFGLSGGVGLEVTLPLDKDVGPLHVVSLRIALGASGDGARLEITSVADLTLGPLLGTVEGIGAALELAPAPNGDQPGGLDAQVAFVPPTRIGLELDLEAASGGGYISIDPEAGRYVGALELDFVEIGLAAIVVVDTELPGDPDGWALFCSLSLTFPSLPLGFGFFLSGVGGIVCLNRTMDAEALAGGLKSGAVDAILFPDDPLADAPLIVSQLDGWFPLAEGSFVFGVAATITWGAPKALVTGEVGVVLTFPELDIALLGSVSMALPDEETALIELHMDALGVIDVSEQTVMVTASLYDSTLLHTISLSGDMALYARLGADPYFLLSVGGYNPHFRLPGDLPAAVTDLRRMRAEVTISEDVWYALEAYVAVTSNTLQFGAEASLEASAKFLLTTYTALGEVGFDVLLVFSPFAFIVDFHASVAVTAGDGDKELLAVSLAAHLEGPKPWYATGTASFDFFGLDVSFDVEVGGAADAEARPVISVLEEVVAALDEPSAWRGTVPVGADANPVTLAEEDVPEGEVWVRPNAELEALQSAAPLDRSLDRYGVYSIEGPTSLAVTAVGIEGAATIGRPTWETVLDWFAPAQYDDMTRTEKLAAPSYEQMAAGVRFGTASVSIDAAQATSVAPVYERRVIDEDDTRALDAQRLSGWWGAATAALGLEPGVKTGTRTVSAPSFAVGATTWQTVDATTGVAAGAAGTYRTALGELRDAVAADSSARASLRLAPSHAVQEGS
jgi:hypothetical protein